jgi:hypothetical protein
LRWSMPTKPPPARREDAPDPADAVLQAPAGLGHEAGGENGARIHDEDGVVIAELREKTVEGLVHGPRFQTNDAAGPRRRGAVSACL